MAVERVARCNVGVVVPLYAIALVVGVGLAVPFVVGSARHLPRLAVGALLGFGLGGMSSSFAGWPSVVAFLGAIGGGGVLAIGAMYLAPTAGEGQE